MSEQMKKLELVGKVGGRTKNAIKYHSRSGKPKIHANKAGKRFIMVRAANGKGVKRLYEGSKYEEK